METISCKTSRERVERDPPGVEAAVLSRMKELSLDAPLELFKLVAWIHMLKDKATRDRCKDLVRTEFVVPHAMSYDSYEYGRALELSDALSAPEDALTSLRTYISFELAHQAGSAGATSEWDAQSLMKQLERVVQDRKHQSEYVRPVTESGERMVVRDPDLHSARVIEGAKDELGGPVDAEAYQTYQKFTKSNRFAA